MNKIIINTEDYYPLSARLFEPRNSNRKFLLINSATGVRQYLYFSFAEYFASLGYTVLTYDYRGIGESKPLKMSGFEASMRTWGSVDFKAVTAYMKSQYPDYTYFCVGHSVGALILGMNADAKLFESFVFVATQKAYVDHLNLKTKLTVYLGFGLAQPLVTQLKGYFPAQYFGLGESLPKDVAFDWRALVLNKKSTNFLLEQTINLGSELTQEVLVLRADDDTWVTQQGIDALFAETYPHLHPSFKIFKSKESPQKDIGHINFFRSYNQSLWVFVVDWLAKKN